MYWQMLVPIIYFSCSGILSLICNELRDMTSGVIVRIVLLVSVLKVYWRADDGSNNDVC